MNRNFTKYWIGQSVSMLGSNMSLLAFPLLVLSMDGSTAQVGLIATSSQLTRLLLRLPAGHVADMVSPRLLMITADLIRLAALGSIPLVAGLAALGYPHLLVVATVEGAATAVSRSASSVIIANIVASEDLAAAFGREHASMAAALLSGPFLGGVLFAVDPILPFTVDAASYATSAALLLWMTAGHTVTGSSSTGDTGQDRSPLAGLRWLSGQRPLLRVLAFAMVFNLIAASAEVAVIVALRANASASPVVGVVMASAGVGAVIGSLLASRVIKAVRPGVLFVAVGTAWAIGAVVFSTSASPWVVGPALALLMTLTPSAGITISRCIVGMTPRELLGRVRAATDVPMSGLAALGPLLTGLAVGVMGVPHTWLALGAIALITTVVMGLPMLRLSAALTPARQG